MYVHVVAILQFYVPNLRLTRHLFSSTSLVGVDNAKSGICFMYVCMDGTYAP